MRNGCLRIFGAGNATNFDASAQRTTLRKSVSVSESGSAVSQLA
jgi:hypothetical protein